MKRPTPATDKIETSQVERLSLGPRPRFTLLGFLTIISLFSLIAGPALHEQGIEGLATVVQQSLLLTITCVGGHRLANLMLKKR